jgi:hypothetical protein
MVMEDRSRCGIHSAILCGSFILEIMKVVLDTKVTMCRLKIKQSKHNSESANKNAKRVS